MQYNETQYNRGENWNPFKPIIALLFLLPNDDDVGYSCKCLKKIENDFG